MSESLDQDIPVVCPKCGRVTKAPASAIGFSGRCAGCGEVFVLRKAVEKVGPPVVEAAYGRDGRLKVRCPACAKKFRLNAELAGKQAMCLCGERLRISSTPTPAAGGGAVGRPAEGRPTPRSTKPVAPADDLEEPISYSFLDGDEEPEGESALAPAPPPRGVAGSSPGRRASKGAGKRSQDEDGDTWKWWYFVVAGVLIIGFSVWQIVDGEPIIRLGGRRGGPVGGLILGTLSIAIGLFSRPGRGED